MLGQQHGIMEVRAMCIKLLILLCTHYQEVDAVSLRMVPNRLQFFEYESVTFYCEDAVYWEVVHNSKGKINSCSHTNQGKAGSLCIIKSVYPDDSGERWCETKGANRSNSINITVTAGSVILESPAVPVMEGEAVTLRCRNKTASSNFTSNFYKDGAHVHSNATEDMIIQKVSKSDEGLYTCNISGGGQSPESWLSVTESSNEIPSPCVTSWKTATISLSALLLLVGLHHLGKCRQGGVSLCQSTKVDVSRSFEDQTVSTEASTVNVVKETYAVVRQSKASLCQSAKEDSLIEDQTEPGPITRMPSACTSQPVSADPFYSVIS
ncbi:low affinity immunoglobulin gamma Fc region receptor III-like isoform X2 [Oreochromis niloticus]|uniref:low affinity immunoglobulin gamma Fc region receptor III-like isoform X2 n=1 Tax=Oreochromis niloticus TaxID=8128 RepID=UPI000905795D|nr:low affinity immunoglobulin gamma Fc region receptor III-like isoform X2 [Oreochromis niloticus]